MDHQPSQPPAQQYWGLFQNNIKKLNLTDLDPIMREYYKTNVVSTKYTNMSLIDVKRGITDNLKTRNDISFNSRDHNKIRTILQATTVLNYLENNSDMSKK